MEVKRKVKSHSEELVGENFLHVLTFHQSKMKPQNYPCFGRQITKIQVQLTSNPNLHEYILGALVLAFSYLVLDIAL